MNSFNLPEMHKKLFLIFLLTIVTSHGLSPSKNEKTEPDSKWKAIRAPRGTSSLPSSDYDGNDIDEDSLPIVDNEEPRRARPYKHPGHWATPAPESGETYVLHPLKFSKNNFTTNRSAVIK